MAWNEHSTERTGRLNYTTYRCSRCRRWAVIPEGYGSPDQLGACVCEARR